MDDDDRTDLIRRLFYLMTVKLEDAAGQAAEGQGREEPCRSIDRAEHIRAFAHEAGIIAEAVAELLRSKGSDS